MPWIEETKVEQRLKFVLRVREEGWSIARACREANISRPTGYKWLNRYDDEGLDGLDDRSRAPKNIPHKTDEQTEQLVCALREEYPNLGPKKLRAWLAREHPDADWPAPSTIGNILDRNGLIEERTTRRKTPPATDPLGEADEPNRIWSADFKGQFEVQNGSMCYPLTVTDNFSRMLLGCVALPSTKGKPVQDRFERLFKEYGLPEAIRTDNGSPFASRAAAGLSYVSAGWLSLGIEHERIEPGKPQQNGRHERMHLTLKKHTARPAEETLEDQQESFDDFRGFYNELRPHEALEQKTPCSYYSRSDRAYPDNAQEPGYATCDVQRSVNSNGYIKFASQSIYVSEALRGHQVGLVEADVDVWVVNFAGIDVGLFEPGDRSMSPLEKLESTKRETL